MCVHASRQCVELAGGDLNKDFACVSLLTKNNDIFVLLNKGRIQCAHNFHQLQFDKVSRSEKERNKGAKK